MNNIKEYRNSIGITQKRLGKAVGVGQSTIDRYENGVRKINYQTAWMIVDSLNQLGAHCSFDDVFPNPKHKNSLTTSKPLDGPYQKVTTNESDQHPRKNRELKDKPHGRHGRTAV
ncbi:helix-turn-helix transcriptional regulator [Vibrio metschnikovii]|uniref:helix-turn-helix transcriptional regulator n=2 Tax=Vibrio metschnikovii TaxID=28172 RepID=UPI002971D88B|nr:helix-turn-helix transcriptional regulator [Vibrio metschnikovii]EKO3658735.1 helix-turn-helix transcriptional regulator [Vibrio metschnikovii]